MKLFDTVELRRPPKNKFNLSHEKKLSCNMGQLVPIMVQEVVPGDKFRVKSEIFARFAPMLAPIMHRVDATVHYFFVPNRLTWSEWEDFITGGPNGTTAPVAPYFNVSTALCATSQLDVGTLSDFMGVPTFGSAAVIGDPQKVSVLPYRAYQLIYNEYYRDQNLTPEVSIPITSGQMNPGADLTALLTLRRRCWEKDYFTSALPFAQRGPAVTIPIQGAGAVTYLANSLVKNTSGGTPVSTDRLLGTSVSIPTGALQAKTTVSDAGTAARIENIDTVTINNVNTTINDLRRAYRLQEWLEKNARAGARYVEQLLSHFGVRSSDARLQRPEYLGGGKSPVRVSEVLSTYQDPSGTGDPQANMAGHGVVVGDTNSFSRFFEEHGYVIGILSLLPRTGYQNGMPRHLQRFDKYDYYWPEFAQIGEQAILRREVYYDGAGAAGASEVTFGYTPRYSEYKFSNSTTHGKMRTNLAYWHMNRIFSSAPSLNTSFVESDPTFRIFANETPTDEHVYIQLFNRVDALRPMPYYGTPTF